MLAQFDDDRVGHDLAAMNLRRPTPVNRGVPSRLGIGVNCHLEISGADPLLYDFFELRAFCLPS